jgi:hypothetical protein
MADHFVQSQIAFKVASLPRQTLVHDSYLLVMTASCARRRALAHSEEGRANCPTGTHCVSNPTM